MKTLTHSKLDRVYKYINNMRKNEPQINLLFNGLENYGALILVGGVIRDIAYYNKRPRDIDIIVDSKGNEIGKAFEKFNYKKNRFGGYKVEIGNMIFDIWSLESHWAFREKLLDAKLENLPGSVFYNIDSLFLGLNDRYYNFNYFNNAIESNMLDIVLKENFISLNPYPDINVVRALMIRKTLNLKFSKRTESYINNWVSNSISIIDNLDAAQRKHYGYICEPSKNLLDYLQ